MLRGIDSDAALTKSAGGSSGGGLRASKCSSVKLSVRCSEVTGNGDGKAAPRGLHGGHGERPGPRGAARADKEARRAGSPLAFARVAHFIRLCSLTGDEFM
ncbi:hypothetical protein SKAU_G00058430 [Synaphobranchus kaupii]|uniref:Uncharacterized protein n=1 Tax=Synaphobranchus kaupii TaxID=118154 RepID=A0A9Q1G4B4_SYNKA|nr:hypothetical protein SKAU_G00058430 [Synaphobranchus kaupii]